MKPLDKTLSIATSPHLHSGATVPHIMGNVAIALVPVSAFAVYVFGLNSLLLLTTAVASCLISEHLLCRCAGKTSTLGDYSALVTGLLFGLTLPPNLPLWMVALGGFLAIAMGKFLFGGLGYNPFNPALVGRAFLQAAFPAAMTSWSPAFAPERWHSLASSSLAWPLSRPQYDAVSAATPLSQFKFEQQSTESLNLFMGLTSGSAGETCSVLILLGGGWLAYKKLMNWRIPVSILASVACLSWLLHSLQPAQYAAPLFMLFSGGLMLGAVFMATDMVASPMTNTGVVLYGLLIGVLVVVIRYWGGMPEGVMYAILLSNALAPHIDRWTQHKVFGVGPKGDRQ